MDEKLFEKAAKTKTMEELKALMNENGLKMNEDKAEEFYARIHSDGALSDDELDGLSGGHRDEELDSLLGGRRGDGVKRTTTVSCPKCSAWMEISTVTGIGICPRCRNIYDCYGYLG